LSFGQNIFLEDKMKKVILAVIAVGFLAVSCGGGGKNINSTEELKAYLDNQPANSSDNPIKVSMSVNDMTIGKIKTVLSSAGKYVNLNLSGNALTKIPDGAFIECARLTGITIPDSVANIGEEAFAFCTSLTAINVDTSNTTFSSQDGVVYNKNKTTLVVYPEGKTGAFTIPSGITSIGDRTFSECKNLTSVTFQGTIPSSGFSNDYVFTGDLRYKYLAGGVGTYTKLSGWEIWTKQ
jgi:hypothetical protein